METGINGWSSGIEPELDTPSLTRSSWGSGTSVSSDSSGDLIDLDQRPSVSFPGVEECTPKPPRKHSELMKLALPSLFGKGDPLKAASTQLDKIRHDLLAYDEKFQYPSDLRFSMSVDSPIMLADIEKYKPVLEQIRKLNGLQLRLAGVQTYGDRSLERKHAQIDAAINLALQIIDDRRLKLYEQAVESALDDIILELNVCIRQFEYPPKLDFVPSSGNDLILVDTERNKPFVNQLRNLIGFREKLNNIPAYGDEQLWDRRKNIGMAIERALQKMRRHQLKLYRHRNTKGCRSRPIQPRSGIFSQSSNHHAAL